jgi:hypothetical protein
MVFAPDAMINEKIVVIQLECERQSSLYTLAGRDVLDDAGR